MLTNVSRRRLASKAMNQRVLIIEDEFLIALDVADTIESMGLKVVGLANGRKHALSLAAHADIALVDVTGARCGNRDLGCRHDRFEENFPLGGGKLL